MFGVLRQSCVPVRGKKLKTTNKAKELEWTKCCEDAAQLDGEKIISVSRSASAKVMKEAYDDYVSTSWQAVKWIQKLIEATPSDDMVQALQQSRTFAENDWDQIVKDALVSVAAFKVARAIWRPSQSEEQKKSALQGAQQFINIEHVMLPAPLGLAFQKALEDAKVKAPAAAEET